MFDPHQFCCAEQNSNCTTQVMWKSWFINSIGYDRTQWICHGLNNYWIVLRELPIAQLTRCLRKTLSQPQVTQPTKVIPDFPWNMHIRASSECVAIGSIFRSDSKKVNTPYCRCSQVPNLLSLLSQTESASSVLIDPAVGLQTTHPYIFRHPIYSMMENKLRIRQDSFNFSTVETLHCCQCQDV